MVLNLMIGNDHPADRAEPDGPVGDQRHRRLRIFRAAIPYVWALLAVLILITYIPALTTFLPNCSTPD